MGFALGEFKTEMKSLLYIYTDSKERLIRGIIDKNIGDHPKSQCFHVLR